jgi:hypothetical protein
MESGCGTPSIKGGNIHTLLVVVRVLQPDSIENFESDLTLEIFFNVLSITPP